jgi:hypothetical protein
MKKALDIILPLALLPITILFVSLWGHAVGTLILGSAMLYYFTRSGINVKRYMITLAVFSAIFETANVAGNHYAYTGISTVPFWVPLGWSVLGWWALNLKNYLKIQEKNIMAFALIFLTAVSLLSGQSILSVLVGLTGLWMISRATNYKFVFFTITFLAALLIEFSGTYFGLWTYSTPSGLPKDWILLGMSYSVFVGACLWLSGIKKETDAKIL